MSNRSSRRFTPLQENYAVAALLADCAGAETGRPYPVIETRNGREYWAIGQIGRGKIRTGVRLRDVMLASVELRQARWVWNGEIKQKVPAAREAPTLH